MSYRIKNTRNLRYYIYLRNSMTRFHVYSPRISDKVPEWSTELVEMG